MPRKPNLWFWEARQCWYTQISGKKIRLHPDKKLAEREFYRIMAAQGMLDMRESRRITVADAAEAMIESSVHWREATKRIHIEKLGALAAAFPGRLLSSIRAEEVVRWLASYQGLKRWPSSTWSDSTRHQAFGVIKELFRWAREMGHLDVNPLARTPNPWHKRARERGMTADEYNAVMEKANLNDEFKEVVEFVWRSGMRPGEVATVSACHLDAKRPIARFQPTEHKTGTKTGLQREVYLPEDLWLRLQEYAKLRPKGPLLRNHKTGKPWTQHSISNKWAQIAKALGLDCVLYQARHSFLTRLVDAGVPLPRAAKIAGHTSTNVLTRTYYHPDTEQMLSDVEKAGRVDEISKKVEEARDGQSDQETQP